MQFNTFCIKKKKKKSLLLSIFSFINTYIHYLLHYHWRKIRQQSHNTKNKNTFSSGNKNRIVFAGPNSNYIKTYQLYAQITTSIKIIG